MLSPSGFGCVAEEVAEMTAACQISTGVSIVKDLIIGFDNGRYRNWGESFSTIGQVPDPQLHMDNVVGL
jgi:hypothetical protein